MQNNKYIPNSLLYMKFILKISPIRIIGTAYKPLIKTANIGQSSIDNPFPQCSQYEKNLFTSKSIPNFR